MKSKTRISDSFFQLIGSLKFMHFPDLFNQNLATLSDGAKGVICADICFSERVKFLLFNILRPGFRVNPLVARYEGVGQAHSEMRSLIPHSEPTLSIVSSLKDRNSPAGAAGEGEAGAYPWLAVGGCPAGSAAQGNDSECGGGIE